MADLNDGRRREKVKVAGVGFVLWVSDFRFLTAAVSKGIDPPCPISSFASLGWPISVGSCREGIT